MYAILGPTASGKSALAVTLAQRLGGGVVNGDPFQAYAGLAIGTGQPDKGEQGGIPHFGYGELGLDVSMNPNAFGSWVRARLDSHPHPVLVTGSGLYLRGIWDQMDVLPEVDPRLTERVREWGQALGSIPLHRYLSAVDPRRARELHPHDRSRIQRALALHLATGQPPSTFLSGAPKGVPEGWKALLVQPSRDQQRHRVERRVRAMVEAGWLEEVQTLLSFGAEQDLLRLHPLGYAEWVGFLRHGGEQSTVEAEVVAQTQAYAKRQSTWFRNQLPGIEIWDPDAEDLESAFRKLGLV